jgi:hypothetical protein
LHVTQAIWLSGGADYPGDLGDGRFNQLILEHGYQSIRGVYHWSSPSQFFPTPHTLGYSDTHAGTLPLYALLRRAGFTMEGAWQAWFVVVAALNVAAALRLFRALGVSGWLRGPIVFAAVSSATLVWQTGTHMQLLPLFPVLLAWAELVRWGEDRRHARLFAASGWFAWQFAAGPYLAFFGVAITGAVGLLRLVAGLVFVTETAAPRTETGNRAKWLAPAIIFVAGWSLAAAAGWIYIGAAHDVTGRSMTELVSLTPDPSSWFSASPGRLFYPPGWPCPHADPVEHAWFAGFLPWTLMFAALAVGIKCRRNATGAWMFATAGGVLLIVLFFTKWSDAHPGAWITVARLVEPLRAFRASGRIAGLLQVAVVAAAGLLLASWRIERAVRWRWVPGACAILLALEGLAFHQTSQPLAVARARSDAMIAAWRGAGDRPVLAFAFGYTNQPESYFNLDAWSAALRLKRATLNGYTGGQPGSHHRFIWNPTVDNARSLMESFAIPPGRVSLVERFSPEQEAALGITHHAQRPTVSLVDFDLQPFAWKLYAPLELWRIAGVPMYQFTPAAEVQWRLPDRALRIEYLVGFRPDAYTDGGQTDGAGVTWLLRLPGEPDRMLSCELLTPVTKPEHRGLLRRRLDLPPGRDRVLILRTDTGPAHSLPWDLLLVGRLRVK